MSLEEMREHNIQIVVERALELFKKRGIAGTKIKDIAKAAHLTERSVYRYFNNKTDIVLEAANYYYQVTAQQVFFDINGKYDEAVQGIEIIRDVLYHYANLYFEDPEGVRFTLDVELFLYHMGEKKSMSIRPPKKFGTHDSPLARAIERGITDGSVTREVNAEELYYNAFDSILGVMQKMAYDCTETEGIDSKHRMQQLCDVFVEAFKSKKK